jgi:hypothetical protein
MVDGSRVFDYLESSYPDIVGPAGVQSEILGLDEIPVHYRCYNSRPALPLPTNIFSVLDL